MIDHPAPIGDHELARRKAVQARAAGRVTTLVDEQIARLHADAERTRAEWEAAHDAIEDATRRVARVLWAALTCFAVALVVAVHTIGGIL